MEKKLILLSISIIGFIQICRSESVNVREIGATGDSNQLATTIIQKAIDQVAKEGGSVYFPAGIYQTGTLYLKSNITLHLEKGATILGSTDLKDYPENLPAYSFFRKGSIKRALIYAEKCENIAIEGEGTIDGRGYEFMVPEDKNLDSYSVRPYVIWMIQCTNVRTEGVKLQNSALWMQHYMACNNVYIHDIEVYNHSNKNNDMMDIDGCRDVIISDCMGDTDDDGITLKSTHGQPNENITISNCIISSHCNAIKCGTESNAGFKNITITNCVIRPSADKEVIYGKPGGINGISFEVVDGAEMNGVHISNIIMDGAAVPLFIRLGNRARGYDASLPAPAVGSIQNITISNITAFNAQDYGSSITGIPGFPVKNVTLENIRFYYSGGGTLTDASVTVPEKERSYPEATMFDKLPAYALYVRHVENLSMENIQFLFTTADHRSPVWLEDVTGADIAGLRADVSKSGALINIQNCRDLIFQNIAPTNRCNLALNISGKETRGIKVLGLDESKFDYLLKMMPEVDNNQVIFLDFDKP